MLKTDTRQAKWRRANPGKYEAHLAVQRAVKAGDLEKESCEVCGVEEVDAHHDQYDEPLRVRWLCRRHHTRLHHYGEDMFPVGVFLPYDESSVVGGEELLVDGGFGAV
ncbi:hypothetical protein [Neorhizobium sp. AL 9.2.2]|uniref:hypothetical protein n=1 Tax=Neorhizobium sp. AL 9.2.2 TaxID=2712894 RepID=UPI001FCEC390|nr:hypothetical protein [Neorhizobium sp. AL 9.2.2]